MAPKLVFGIMYGVACCPFKGLHPKLISIACLRDAFVTDHLQFSNGFGFP
jgi:hypothetical protein